MQRVRRSLGNGNYSAAFEEGRAAATEEAIARALAELEALPSECPPDGQAAEGWSWLRGALD